MLLQIRKSDQRIVGYASSGLEEDAQFYIAETEEMIDDASIFFSTYHQGKILFDPAYKEQVLLGELRRHQEMAGQEVFNQLAKSIVLKAASDNQAYAMRYMYDAFDSDGYAYQAGDRLMYEDRFYKVLQDHVSQAEWMPDTAVSLYAEIANPAEQWPEWRQPVSAETAYALGAQVTYAGQKYISQIASNTAEPGSDERWWKEV